LRIDFGAPVVQGNSFAGADDPVFLSQSRDVAGVKSNTASGPPKHGVFVYNGVELRGTWTPESLASGVQHRVNAMTVKAGGHALLGAGVLVKSAHFVVEGSGKLSSAGTSAQPAVITSQCDSSVGGETSTCDPAGDSRSIGELGWQPEAVLDLAGADIRRQQVNAGGDGEGVKGVSGSVHDSTITETTIFEHPARLAWQDNQFVKSTLRIDRAAPVVQGNSFTGVDDPVFFSESRDVAGVRDNTASGPPKQGVFVYNGVEVRGTWTPESLASGVQHSINAMTVKAGGHALLRAGVLVKSDHLVVEAAGKLSTTGTADAPAVITTQCDSSVGGETSTCDPAGDSRSIGEFGWLPEAVLDLAGADIRHQQVNAGGDAQGVKGVNGSVHDSALTDTTIFERPANLTWKKNQFTRTTLRVDNGEATVLEANRFADASTVELRGIRRPVLDKNIWTGVVSPLMLTGAADLSGVAPTNEATGDEDEQRRLSFSGSSLPGIKSMSGIEGSKAIYVFDGVEIHGDYTSPAGAIVDLASDLELEALGSLTATDTEFRSLEDEIDNAIEADAGTTLLITGGSIEGKVVGSCDEPYLGGANIVVSDVQFSGAAQIRNCNTDATGGIPARAFGSTGVKRYSFHENTCVWALAEPVPPPPSYPRHVWDVAFGGTDGPACKDGYIEIVNSTPSL
jgi:hypothetical protein